MKISDLVIQLNYTNGVTHEIQCDYKTTLRVNNVQRTKLDKNIEIIHEVDGELELKKYVEEPIEFESVKVINKATGDVMANFDELEVGYYMFYNDNFSGRVLEVLSAPIK